MPLQALTPLSLSHTSSASVLHAASLHLLKPLCRARDEWEARIITVAFLTVAAERWLTWAKREKGRTDLKLDSHTICLEKDRDVVFMPCFHLVACWDCSKRMCECPICRKNIGQKRRVYN